MSKTLDEWCASLKLDFELGANGRSILTCREHTGPLLVQRGLYPEGPHVCHVVILHPPSGIAGGDNLHIHVNVAEGASAVVSTPGATRWYKSNGRDACQVVNLRVAKGGQLDWLPMENIFFEQAKALSRTVIALESGATAIGWDIFQLGKVNKPNHWDEGLVDTQTCLTIDGKHLWIDQGQIAAGDAVRRSVSGLSDFPVHAVLWCFGPKLEADQQDVLARLLPWESGLRGGSTTIPYDTEQALYLVRGLGIHLEEVQRMMSDAWAHLRRHVLNTPAIPPRLWAT